MRLRNKKTGEIIRFYDGISLNGEDYDSLAELNEEWEDYKPDSPLIKDEKVRKAVRAWAEANKTITKIHVMNNGYELYGGNTESVIHFETIPFYHIAGGDYTIAELCGEEGE